MDSVLLLFKFHIKTQFKESVQNDDKSKRFSVSEERYNSIRCSLTLQSRGQHLIKLPLPLQFVSNYLTELLFHYDII